MTILQSEENPTSPSLSSPVPQAPVLSPSPTTASSYKTTGHLNSNTVTSAPTTAVPRGRRFRFIESYDFFLLRAVCSVDVHLAGRGQSEGLYQKVHERFMDMVPAVVFRHMRKPSCKTLVDRFKRLVGQRREVVKRTARESGIIERYGEKEVLMDDLIQEMDEKEEVIRAEKDEQTENEKRLLAVGEHIRLQALKRLGSEEGKEEIVSSSPIKRRCRR